MEALSQNFTEAENFSDQSTTTIKVEKPSLRVLINPETVHTVTNTDIVLCINEFHKSLADDQEVGIKITHLGQEILFYIDHIAHQNQSVIYFKGHTENNRSVHFVKHASDLKIVLQTLVRRAPETPKTPFGFADWDAYEKIKQLNS